VLGDPKTEIVPFGCDGSKIAACDIPTIVLGPGDIAQAHTKDEHITIKDLEAGMDAYENLAVALLS
jgi:acetylornithine deacetylase